MPLTVRDAEDNTRVIAISGKFAFEVHRDFRNAYKNTNKDVKFVLDLRNAEYMDSSALGMILLLREFVDQDHSRLRIINCTSEIMEIFTVSNMDKIIEISRTTGPEGQSSVK